MPLTHSDSTFICATDLRNLKLFNSLYICVQKLNLDVIFAIAPIHSRGIEKNVLIKIVVTNVPYI